MKRAVCLFLAGSLFVVAACSLPPVKPVTRDQLYQTQVYSRYIIRESPESVLAAINREGEVVLEAKYRNVPVYIKILATKDGLNVSVHDR